MTPEILSDVLSAPGTTVFVALSDPFIYLWNRDGGIAAGLCEPVLREVSFPVCRPSGSDRTSASVRYDFPQRSLFSPGDTLWTYSTFISAHRGDYFDPLRTFTALMEQEYGIRPADSEPEAFEPVWCAWGYERTFSPDEIISTLPKVKELGFKWVDVDDGYQLLDNRIRGSRYLGPFSPTWESPSSPSSTQCAPSERENLNKINIEEVY